MDPPLLALPASRLFAVLSWCVHSRPANRSSGRGFHAPTSCSALVVSHHLGGFLRTRAAGLLHPAPGLEVRRVSVGSAHLRASRSSTHRGRGADFPATWHPSKGSPRHAAVPHHCGRFPLAVHRPHESPKGDPSARAPLPGHGVRTANREVARLQGVAPPASPWRRDAVSSVRRSLLPWASGSPPRFRDHRGRPDCALKPKLQCGREAPFQIVARGRR